MPPRSTTGVKGLYRASDGSYRVDHRWVDVETGEHRRFRKKLPAGTTAVAAKAYARRVMNAILDGTFTAERAAPVTVREALDRYLEHAASHGLASLPQYTRHLRVMGELLGPKRPLGRVEAADLERAKAKLSETRGPAGTNRHLAAWKSAMSWAADAGVVDRGHVAELRAVKLRREPQGRVRWLSPAELEVVREKLDGWLRPIVLVIIGTGARRAEIVGLRWRDVDREHREIILRHTKNRKTRHVPMSDAVLAVIDGLPAGEPDAYVFHVPAGDAHRPNTVSTAWRTFCRAHGLEDLRLHDLRHHAATMMRRAGHGLDVVAGVLGHSTVAMSARYAHLGRGELAAATDAASRSIAQPMPNESKGGAESAAKQGT